MVFFVLTRFVLVKYSRAFVERPSQGTSSLASRLTTVSLDMVHLSHSIEQQKQFYNCEANRLGVLWCSYYEQTNLLHVYRCLLTNHLHGKAAELCLANS